MVGIKERVKLLGFNWTAEVSSADPSITETEQIIVIIVSHCCSWLYELLTLEAESCASLCFVGWWWWHLPYTWCFRGVSTASAGAPMEAVSILGRSASGQWGGIGVHSYTLFSSDFYHSPMSFSFPPKMFRQIPLFWRMFLWNTVSIIVSFSL